MRETFFTTCLRYASPSSAQARDFHTPSPKESADSTSCFPEAGTSTSWRRLSARAGIHAPVRPGPGRPRGQRGPPVPPGEWEPEASVFDRPGTPMAAAAVVGRAGVSGAAGDRGFAEADAPAAAGEQSVGPPAGHR